MTQTIRAPKVPLLLKSALTVAVSATLLAGCNDSNDSDSIDATLQSLITAQSLTGDPSTGRDIPDISDPVAQLGMLLFFTKGLGGDQDSACVTCHHPTLGGGDDLSLPIGVEAVQPDLLGPGRVHSATGTDFDGGPTVPRNAPTTFNLALWDSVLFHDGRIESLGKTAGANGDDGAGIRTPDSAFGTADALAGPTLATAQARFPVTSPEEMRGHTFEHGNSTQDVRDHLSARLSDTGIGLGELARNFWLEEFQTAYNDFTSSAEDLITYQNIQTAIATYERSQTFVNTPWKAYVDGDTSAISDAAKRGAELFFTDISAGGAGCASCHSGDFFSDEGFHVVAMPQVGRGKGNGDTGDDDFGRMRETGDSADKYAFRTPSLLNVEVTGPYTHAGAYDSLEDVVRHHINPAIAIDQYSPDAAMAQPGVLTSNWEANTRKALAQLQANRAAGVPSLQDNNGMSEQEIDDLVAFLLALTDPCVKDRACLADWIPDDTDPNPDNLIIFAVDGDGNLM